MALPARALRPEGCEQAPVPWRAKVDWARPNDSKGDRILHDPFLVCPRRRVLADVGFEPPVNGIHARHKVTVTTKGWRTPNKPKGFEPIEPPTYQHFVRPRPGPGRSPWPGSGR